MTDKGSLQAAEARQLARVAIAAGGKCGATLRAIGGAGVMLLYSPKDGQPVFRSETGDVDLVGPFGEQLRWEPIMKAIGFELQAASKASSQALYEFAGDFRGKQREIHVYSDPLKFTEVVPGPYYTAEWPDTVPPSVLLLSKLLVRREYDESSQRQDIAALIYASSIRVAPLEMMYLRSALRRGVSGWRRWLSARTVLDALICDLESSSLEFAGLDRSALVQLRLALENSRTDWRWRLASWWHGHRLPGPVYMTDDVEPLPDAT